MDTNTHPVVVAFNGSDDATAALRWAIDDVGRTGHRLQVVVATPDPDTLPPVMRPYEADIALRAASRARDILKHEPGADGDVVVRHGPTVPVLLEEARAAASVVVGSRGHGEIEGEALGSVSQHLAGHAPCPVVVVRPPHDPAATRIVVGVDGSPGSATALAHACERASATGESVLAVHAYRHRDLGAPDDPVVAAAERLVAEAVAGAVVDHPEVELRSEAVEGRPGRVLARLSENASLVVVGSRGRSTFLEMVLGSVAQDTLRHARCPVAVVR